MSSRSSYPRVSLGAEYTSMICFSCGNDGAHACLDKNGCPYVSCRYCKARSLSLSLRAVASLRFLTEMLRDEKIRKTWAMSIAHAEVRRWEAPTRDELAQPVAAPVTAPEGVNRG